MQEGQYESSVPTVTDRVVQASLKLVLEPIFEADFQPFSYGFRPGRRQHDAIAEIHHLASEPRNYCWVLIAEIHHLASEPRNYCWVLEVLLGTGGRHQGVLRRNRACPPDGPGAR